MKRKKLTLPERADRASTRVYRVGFAQASAYDGYLAGYRAAQRDGRAELKALKAQRAVLFNQRAVLFNQRAVLFKQRAVLFNQADEFRDTIKTLREINTYETRKR